MRTIRTVEDVVDALGGDTEVARWLKITPAGVNHWKTRQEIPGGWHMRVYARLLERACSPARRQDRNAALMQRLSEFDEAGFVGDGEEG